MAVVAGPSEGSAPPPMPDYIESAHGGNPPWIAASWLVDEAGRLRQDSIAALPPGFDDGSLTFILEQAGRSDSPCVHVGKIYSGLPPGFRASHSLDDLVDNAKAVLRGTVVQSAGGFNYGVPGLLLQVRVDERLVPAPGSWNASYVYVSYPVGEFSIGSIRVCKTDDSWPAPPAAGTPVLLFPQRTAMDEEGVHVSTLSILLEIVWEDEGGLRAPEWLTRYGDLDELTDRVRRRTSGGGAR